MTNTVDLIEQQLIETLSPEQLTVQDDAAEHAGHANEGAGHFTIIVTAAAFDGKSPVARHQLVYQALGTLMQTHIHAVRIRAYAPGENNT